MDRTSRNRPHSIRKNGHYRDPQDNHANGGNKSLRSSRDTMHQMKRMSSSNSDTNHSLRNGKRSNNKSMAPTPPSSNNNSGVGGSGNNNFAKWAVTVVMFMAIADLILLWTSIDATIGDQNGDQPHQIGPEVGLHQLTEKSRTTDIQFQWMNDIVKKKQQQQHEEAKKEQPTKRRRSSQEQLDIIEEERRRRYAPIEKVKNVAKVNKVQNTETFGVDDHIVKILTAANIPLDEELARQLPTWDDIVSMYGDKPIIHGLETCPTYRDTVVPADRMLGPAGIFNTGTNLLFELMKANCNIKEARTSKTHREPKRNGMRFQPPWGKVRMSDIDVLFAEYYMM
jgi:hypothetical protein